MPSWRPAQRGSMGRPIGIVAGLALIALGSSPTACDALGFKLASEEYLTQTIEGQTYSFKTNPKLKQSIKIERISDYEYHHRPRGGDMHSFQEKISSVFGGDFDRQTKKHVNSANQIHSEAWSLIEQGHARKASILLDAHENGDHDRVQLVRESIPHVANPDHEAKHDRLQRLVLLENSMEEVTKMDLGEDWKCVYSSPCKKDIDLTKNGVCRVFGCGAKECLGEAKSKVATLCEEKGEPKCKKPCPNADESLKDLYVLEKQAPNFWSTALAESGPIRPQVRVFGCVQADLSLLELSGIPAVIQLGIFGQIGYNTGDKCFSWGVDAALGIFFGVKVGGVNFGISINLIGSLSLDEQPFEGGDEDIVHDGFQDVSEKTIKSVERLHQQKPVVGECPGRRPFALWGAFADKVYKGLTRDAAIRKRIAEARKKVYESEGYKAYNDYKKVDGKPARYPLADLKMEPESNPNSFATVATGGKREPKVFGEVGVVQSMRAMANLQPLIEHKYARYASHVLDKALTDDNSGGSVSETKQHEKEATGRYLARSVPGKGLRKAVHKPCHRIKDKSECNAAEAAEHCEWITLKQKCKYKDGVTPEIFNLEDVNEEGAGADKTAEDKEVKEFKGSKNESKIGSGGEAGAGLIFDDRVYSIPKVMRKSYHSGNPYFWREATISTANLFVRIIGDLQAIFNVYFAGSPNWEGDCVSLPGRHTLGFEGAISNNFWTKNNLASEEGEAVDDENWPWFQRHWISDQPVKSGKNGKSTADWFTQCSDCNREDVPSIIYPTPLCLSVEQKLAGNPDDTVKFRKNGVKRQSAEWGWPIEAREDKKYKPDFFKAVGEPPEEVSDSDAGFLLVFDKACNVIKGNHVDKYYECERVYLNSVFVASYPRLVEYFIEIWGVISKNLELIDVSLCEGNTTECHPDPKMTKLAAADTVNEVRMFLLSFINSEQFSHYLHTHSAERKKSAQGGLLPTIKQVRHYGRHTLEKTVKDGNFISAALRNLKRKMYSFWNDGTEKWKSFLHPEKSAFVASEVADESLESDESEGESAVRESASKEPAESMKCTKKVHKEGQAQHGEGWCQCNAEGKKVQSQNSCVDENRKDYCIWDKSSQLCHAKPTGASKASQGPEKTQALLQMNDQGSRVRGRQLLSSSMQLNSIKRAHQSARGGPIEAGGPCKKDEQCQSMQCLGYIWLVKNGHCAALEASLASGEICDRDLECFPKGLGKCIGNMGGITSGTCAYQNLKDGAECKRDAECSSKKCTSGECAASERTLNKGDVCNYDFSCMSGVCAGNFLGTGKCLDMPQDAPGKCDDSRECVSALGCKNGVCLYEEAMRERDESCTVDHECVAGNCDSGKCSDEVKVGFFGKVSDFVTSGVNKLGKLVGDGKRWLQRKYSSKKMPGIVKGIPLQMARDFQTMWGVRITGKGGEDFDPTKDTKADEKMELVGDAYRNIARIGMEIRNDTSAYQDAFYDRSLGHEKSKILNSMPPVVEYTFTFTLDIESQAPGFCTPSSAALQVIVSKSWTGSTQDPRVFRSRQMCMSLRVAPPTTYFMIDMCYDIPECKGLADIDDESEKAEKGEVITSNVEIGFSVFQILQAGEFKEALALIDEGSASGSAAAAVGETDVSAVIDHSGDKDMAKQASSFSKTGGFAEKVKRALQDASLLTGQAVGAIMSRKISWAFAQAFVQDDSVTNDGSNNFMRKGVSLVAMVQFFMQAIAQARLMQGAGGALHDSAIWKDMVKDFDPSNPPTPSMSFKLNNELVMEGRGSIPLQKRACTPTEKKQKEEMCAKEDHKFFFLSKCASEACEVGLPIPNPDVHLTFQSWNRAELTIAVPPVTVFPTMGVEVEFDITRLLYTGVNAKRARDHAKRVERCLKCVSNSEAFCDRKWKSVDYTPGDDVCRIVTKISRAFCESNGGTNGYDDGISPRWITTEEGCTEMKWPEQTEQHVQNFYGNQLRVGNAKYTSASTAVQPQVVGIGGT